MSETGGSSFRATLGVRPPPVSKTVDDKLKDASKMYEKMFLREMMKAMRSTVHESGFIKQNQAEKIFRDELDAETVDNWAESRGGVGMADLIYNNLLEKYGAQLGIRQAIEKPKGPIAFNEKSELHRVSRAPAVGQSEKNDMTLKFDLEKGANRSLLMPWNGTLTEKQDLGEGTSMLGFDYESGFRGRLVFRGQSERLNLGQSVKAGEPLASLSPEAKSFFWTIDLKNVSE
jgi:peptidoglycan hydrolase FlgJ